MSWPSDGQPRFKVGSVTGVPITEATMRPQNGGRVASSLVVLDRAYCYRIVREFSRNGPVAWTQDAPRLIGRRRRRPLFLTAQQQAIALAAQLEAEHAQP